jgi:hypothetical protein
VPATANCQDSEISQLEGDLLLLLFFYDAFLFQFPPFFLPLQVVTHICRERPVAMTWTWIRILERALYVFCSLQDHLGCN